MDFVNIKFLTDRFVSQKIRSNEQCEKARNKTGPRPKALLLPDAKMNPSIQPDETRKTHLGRGGMAVSLAPLTPVQALAAALRVKPAEVKKLEEAEKSARRGRKG